MSRLSSLMSCVLLTAILAAAAPANVPGSASAEALMPATPQRTLQQGRTFVDDPEGAAVAWVIGWDERSVGVFRERGFDFYNQGALPDAVRWLGFAQVLDPGDLPGLKSLAFAFKATGRYEEAHDALAACLAKDSKDFNLWWWYGDVQRLLGDYEESIESLRTAADFGPAERREELTRYVDYSRKLAATGPSWEHFEYHRDFARRHEGVSRVRRLIAEYEAALAVAPETPPDDTEGLARKAWVNGQLGMQHAFLKEYAIGAWYFGRAVDLYTASGNEEDVVRNLNSLGDCYAAIAERSPDDRALFLEEAVAIRARAEETSRSFSALDLWRHALGRRLETLAQARPLEAPELSEVRERAAKEIPFRGPVNDFSLCSILQGEIACRMKARDYAGARVLIEMAQPFLDQSQYLEDTEQAARMNAMLGQCYLAQDHTTQAEEAARRALSGVDRVRGFTDGDTFLRSSAPRTLREAAGVLARAAIRRGDPGAAFIVIEDYQARRMTAMLGAAPASETHRTDYPAELESTRSRANALNEDLELARQTGPSPRARILELCVAHDGRRREWLERESTFTVGARLTAKAPAAVPPSEFQAALPADAAFLSFLADSEGLTSVVVRNDGVFARVTEGVAHESLLDLTRRIRIALANREDCAPLLGELEAAVIAPNAADLTRERLLVVPDAAFAGLPIEALHLDGRRVGEAFTTAYALSAAHVAAALARVPSEGAAIECAPAAPCTAEALLRPGTPFSVLRLRCPVSVMEPNAADSAFLLADAGNQPVFLYWRDLLACRWEAPVLMWLPPGGDTVTEAGTSDALHALAYCAGAAGARGIVLPLWFSGEPEPALGGGSDVAAELRDFRRGAFTADPATPDWCRFVLYVD